MIDGSKNDSCQKVLLNFPWVGKNLFERDNGKFDAMNKGISLASGHYTLFINSGDELYFSPCFERLIKNIHKFDDGFIIYGDVIIEVGKRRYLSSAPIESEITKSKLKLPAHPAIFYPTNFLRQNPYDGQMHVSADTKLFLQAIKYLHLRKLDCPIAVFQIGGISTTQTTLKEVISVWRERHLARHSNVNSKAHLLKMVLKMLFVKFFGYEIYHVISFSMQKKSYKLLS